MYEEGDMADGPNGTLVYRSGQWVPLAQSVRPITVGTPNATKQAKERADLALTEGKVGAQPFDTQKARADAIKAEAEAKLATLQASQGVQSKGLSPEVRAKALAQWNAANNLDNVIASITQQYASGPGATHGLAGLKDFLPTEANQRFDRAGNAGRGIVRNALGLTGGETNTLGEAQMNMGAYIPSASDFDSTILDAIARLRELRDSARHQSTSVLGGVPDANGNITPIQKGESADAGPGARRPDWSWAGTPTFTGPQGPAAPSGSATQAQSVPPQMQAELNAYLQGVPRGQLDQGAFAKFYDSLAASYGQQPASGVDDFVKAYNSKRAPIDTRIPSKEVPMSAVDQMRNNAVNNPVGAAAANFADMAGMGIPTALAPDKMAALQESQPLSSAAGQIGGALLATKGIGEIGKQTIGRVAPNLLGGGAAANFGRNLATDMAFGGGYGGVTEGDPLTGAAAAGLGSVAGQGIGAAGGQILGGAGSKAAEYLRQRKVPLTVGQAMGGLPKRLEDAATSIPGIGDMINARRLEGLKSFNEQALGDVTGNQVMSTGPQGIDDLRPQVSGMYDRATSGVTVPVGPQLSTDLNQARTMGGALPPDLADRFSRAMTNRVDPVVNMGQMTGDEFQQIQRALKGYRAETPKAGFEQDYRDALGMVSGALDNNMRDQGGSAVISGLNDANAAYRKLKVAEDAVGRARNGTTSGESGIFTPSQLNDASAMNAQKFGGSKASMDRPFYDLATNGQEVLPSKIPDSGTAGRLATMALPGLLGGAGAGVGAYTGDTQGGLEKGLAIGGLLAAGGTKVGQKALVKAIMDRPKILKQAGAGLNKKRGLLGSAMAPVLLENFLD